MPITRCKACDAIIDFGFEDMNIIEREQHQVKKPSPFYPDIVLCRSCHFKEWMKKRNTTERDKNDKISRDRI